MIARDLVWATQSQTEFLEAAKTADNTLLYQISGLAERLDVGLGFGGSCRLWGRNLRQERCKASPSHPSAVREQKLYTGAAGMAHVVMWPCTVSGESIREWKPSTMGKEEENDPGHRVTEMLYGQGRTVH